MQLKKVTLILCEDCLQDPSMCGNKGCAFSETYVDSDASFENLAISVEPFTPDTRTPS
jgi:hypothetical protein